MKREEVHARAVEYLRAMDWYQDAWKVMELDEILTDFAFRLFEGVLAHNERLKTEFTNLMNVTPLRPILLPASSLQPAQRPAEIRDPAPPLIAGRTSSSVSMQAACD